MRGNRTEGSVQSVERALDMLEILSTRRHGMGLTVLAEQLALGPSTVHRLLKTLQRRGYVTQTETKLYGIGLKAFEVGRAFLDGLDFYAVSLPVLQRAVDQCNESVFLAVIEGKNIVTVASVDSTHAVRPHGSMVERRVAHATALGKVLLAGLPESRLAEFVTETGLVPLTPYTITSYQGLQRELEEVRRLGVAMDRQEADVGLRCVGAPVRDYGGRTVAAVSVAVPTQRADEARLLEIVDLVKETALSISLKIGYRDDGGERVGENGTQSEALSPLS